MFNVSIVLYRTEHEQLKRIVSQILDLRYLNQLILVDNADGFNKSIDDKVDDKLTYILSDKNGGYGYGHNKALRLTLLSPDVTHHFVINSDIDCSNMVFEEMYVKYKKAGDIGIISPKIVTNSDHEQPMAKLIPTPWDLIKKRFLLHAFQIDKAIFALNRYCIRNQVITAPYLSGCFMLINKKALEKVGLFDERFFMYPEDLDLTRRTYRHFDCIQDRNFSIIHNFEGSSRKNLRMFIVHANNMIRYFNKYGWILDRDAKKLNTRAMIQNETNKNN